MTVWIHIGTRKTGTSTIQAFLSANRPQLHELGYLYPAAGPQGRKVFQNSAHYNLARQLQERQSFDPAQETWEGIEQQTRRNPGRPVILSCEHLQSLTSERVRRLRRYLPDTPVKVIVYLRRQSAYLESQYSQHAKFQGMGESIHDYATRIDDFLTYSRFLDPWRQAFGDDNIVVRLFERGRFRNGDLLDDFLSVVGLPLRSAYPGYTGTAVRNQSPNPKVLALVDAFRSQLSVLHDQEPMGRRQLHEMTAALMRAAGRVWCEREKPRFLTPEQRRSFDHRFEADNALVMRDYFPGRSGALFTAAPDADEPANLDDPGAVLRSLPLHDVLRVLALVSSTAGFVNADEGGDGGDIEDAQEFQLARSNARQRARRAKRRQSRRALGDTAGASTPGSGPAP